MSRDIFETPLVTFGHKAATPPPPKVSRIIWMAPYLNEGHVSQVNDNKFGMLKKFHFYIKKNRDPGLFKKGPRLYSHKCFSSVMIIIGAFGTFQPVNQYKTF
jgi:hypothetical protein